MKAGGVICPLILSEDTRDSPGTTDTLPAASDLAQVEGNREQPDMPAASVQDPRTLGGIVVDPDGKPVPKAMILMANGRNYFKDYGNDLIPLTDADGNFRVEDLDPGLYKFTVFSPDWALQTFQVNIPLAAPLKLTMNKGTRVEFRTVDADGKPISGIKFHPEAPRNGPFTGDSKLNYLHVLDFLSHRYLIGNESDKQGRVIWENAPPDSLGYQIYGNGYMSHMGEDFGPKGSPHTLVFRPTIPVIGTVTDAETAEPVADFDVFQGIKFKSNSSTIPYSWSPERQKTKQPGQFQGTIHNLDRVSCFRIQAKGYRPAITKVLDAANLPDEPIKLDVRLKKDAPYIGKILRPDGQPAVGAAVHIISAEARKRSFATLSNGVFDYPGIHVQTESGNDGAIQIAAHNEPFICCIVHDAGYAQVTDVDLYSMKSIKLDAWAQIEGRTVINGKPAVGATVRIRQGDLFRVGIFPSLVSSTSQTTDENGLYRFEKCVPGRWLRTITFSDAADSDMRGYRISEHVVLQPGETLTAKPNPASTELFGRILLPNDDAVIDAEQSDVYLIKEVSAESAPETHRRLSHRAPLQQDGTNRIYGISAGDYRVTVSAKIKGDESPKSNYSKTVQVKQTAFTDQADTAGIDVGLLEVEEQPLPN